MDFQEKECWGIINTIIDVLKKGIENGLLKKRELEERMYSNSALNHAKTITLIFKSLNEICRDYSWIVGQMSIAKRNFKDRFKSITQPRYQKYGPDIIGYKESIYDFSIIIEYESRDSRKEDVNKYTYKSIEKFKIFGNVKDLFLGMVIFPLLAPVENFKYKRTEFPKVDAETDFKNIQVLMNKVCNDPDDKPGQAYYCLILILEKSIHSYLYHKNHVVTDHIEPINFPK
ncbi:MAG TPA: hypothetical protein VKM55_00615 [Candidatus Lokiarchaeia archaeon]|nr:hypothetical protein [Candidatus Lokiarchaeia archaeon]